MFFKYIFCENIFLFYNFPYQRPHHWALDPGQRRERRSAGEGSCSLFSLFLKKQLAVSFFPHWSVAKSALLHFADSPQIVAVWWGGGGGCRGWEGTVGTASVICRRDVEPPVTWGAFSKWYFTRNTLPTKHLTNDRDNWVTPYSQQIHGTIVERLGVERLVVERLVVERGW